MRINKKQDIVVKIFLALIFFSFPILSESLKFPSAYTKTGEEISEGFAAKIALAKVKELLDDKVAIGKPVLCCDRWGFLSVYMISVRLGSKEFPSNSEILERVKLGKRYLEILKKEGRIADSIIDKLKFQFDIPSSPDFCHKTYDSESLKKKGIGIIPRIRPDGEISSSYKFFENLVFLRNLTYGNNGWITFYISARQNFDPIPLYGHFISPFYYSYEDSLNIAKNHLGVENLTLLKYYFLGHHGQFFEYSNGSQSILINAHSLITIKSIDQVVNCNKKRKIRLPESILVKHEKYIKDKWNSLKERIKNLKESI